MSRRQLDNPGTPGYEKSQGIWQVFLAAAADVLGRLERDWSVRSCKTESCTQQRAIVVKAQSIIIFMYMNLLSKASHSDGTGRENTFTKRGRTHLAGTTPGPPSIYPGEEVEFRRCGPLSVVRSCFESCEGATMTNQASRHLLIPPTCPGGGFCPIFRIPLGRGDDQSAEPALRERLKDETKGGEWTLK
ncbi:hypothetical protein Bbelb_239030 [Branchiostoma belcheri]|nr:hypothetical protein Bbelb_239030 [Branchiostoma belcheri]